MNHSKWMFVAEVHDIGKLVVRGGKHNLEDVEWEKHGLSQETPIVQAIVKHHCIKEPLPGDIQKYPDSYETLTVHLADALASQASRILRGELLQLLRGRGSNFGIYKLWKGETYKRNEPPLYKNYDRIISYLKRDPRGEKFLSLYLWRCIRYSL